MIKQYIKYDLQQMLKAQFPINALQPFIVENLIDNKSFHNLTFDHMKDYIQKNNLCKQYIEQIPTLTPDEKEYLHLL